MSERPKRKNHRLLNAVPTPAKAGAAGPFKYGFPNGGRTITLDRSKWEVAKMLQVLRWFLFVLYRFEQFSDDDYQLPRKLTKPISLLPHIVLILTLYRRKLILARHRVRCKMAEQESE